ncbi:SCO family protein [Rubrolithibacter danxiaensis]|uniref:SCO family protein n=1 Tax=Rubrolithibacter danxiaensis TaxID=3390805 RepID=UPI003BF8945B
MLKKNNYLKVSLILIVLSFVSLSSCTNSKNQAVVKEKKQTTSTESVYQLPGTWQNQEGDSIQLAALRGKLPVVSMIFTHCGYACPRIVADIKNIEKQVPADKKDKVVFVLVSFDTERDQPARLKEFAKDMQLDNNWILLHGDDEEVRELSMLLDVKYKKLPDGAFAHSNIITLLDENGTIIARVEGLGTESEEIVSKIKAL